MDQWRSKFSESFSLDRHWSIERSSLSETPSGAPRQAPLQMKHQNFISASSWGSGVASQAAWHRKKGPKAEIQKNSTRLELSISKNISQQSFWKVLRVRITGEFTIDM